MHDESVCDDLEHQLERENPQEDRLDFLRSGGKADISAGEPSLNRECAGQQARMQGPITRYTI